MALGIVRAAQSRDEEAEKLLREAIDVLEGTDVRLTRRELVGALVSFLRERGRGAEAQEYEAELGAYEPAPA
jgi:hypothetical protein